MRDDVCTLLAQIRDELTTLRVALEVSDYVWATGVITSAAPSGVYATADTYNLPFYARQISITLFDGRA